MILSLMYFIIVNSRALMSQSMRHRSVVESYFVIIFVRV
jgi:hypothetical protein